jgi:DEAD/DEAH box helicase domain-containing protein
MRELIDQLQASPDYRNQIVPNGHRTFTEHLAEFGRTSFNPSNIGELSRSISGDLKDALQSARGISRVYSHQAKAINDIWNNKHVIVSTSTASGKSLIYQLPVLDALEKDPDIKAMYIFPTKALAQDQKKSLSNILSHTKHLSHILVETFDGDTPQSERTRIRENASGC